MLIHSEGIHIWTLWLIAWWRVLETCNAQARAVGHDGLKAYGGVLHAVKRALSRKGLGSLFLKRASPFSKSFPWGHCWLLPFPSLPSCLTEARANFVGGGHVLNHLFELRWLVHYSDIEPRVDFSTLVTFMKWAPVQSQTAKIHSSIHYACVIPWPRYW